MDALSTWGGKGESQQGEKKSHHEIVSAAKDLVRPRHGSLEGRGGVHETTNKGETMPGQLG